MLIAWVIIAILFGSFLFRPCAKLEAFRSFQRGVIAGVVMAKTKGVIVTAYWVECESEVDSIELTQLIRRVRESSGTFSSKHLDLVPTKAFSAFWLDSSTNLAPCITCSQFTSVRSKPDFVAGVPEGKVTEDGSIQCHECADNE